MEKDKFENFDELINKVNEKHFQLGIGTERNRIMKGLLEADLPLGYWDLIKDIINPKEN